MSRKEIMKQIGSLFILRINWGGSILETPVNASQKRDSHPWVVDLNDAANRNSFGRILI